MSKQENPVPPQPEYEPGYISVVAPDRHSSSFEKAKKALVSALGKFFSCLFIICWGSGCDCDTGDSSDRLKGKKAGKD